MIKCREKNDAFKPDEITKLDRIYQDCISRFNKQEDVSLDRLRFVQFVNEYDSRRNKNFLEVFPEYHDFYKLCENPNV